MAVQMRFLGTGASEGIPNPFCDCAICKNARERKGHEIRMRSAFRVTDEMQIDFGPDSFAQSAFLGNDLLTLKHLLITHAHDDHFAMFDLDLVNNVNGELQNKLNVYLTEGAFEMVTAMDKVPLDCRPGFFVDRLKDVVHYERLKFYQTYTIGDIKVTPVKCTHKAFFGSIGANYLMMLPDGKSMLYAVDTGIYTEETIERLQNERLDYLILECTYGNAEIDVSDGHLNIAHANALMERLYANTAITSSTQVFLTHFNHMHTYTHEDLVAYYRDFKSPYTVKVAYDGLKI